MGLGFRLLGSGSSGNATLVSDGKNHVLLDVGLSGRETVRRLRECRVEPERLCAIVVSHEHGDHCRGAAPLAKDLGIPVFITDAALTASGMEIEDGKRQRIRAGTPFEICGILFTPFSVPHDSADPIAFCAEKDGVKIAVVLDLGYITRLVVERLKGCDGIVLESNHDINMLKVGPYPWSLKQRVLGQHGHLSNDMVADFLSRGFDGRARHIVLAHLSLKNNLPELAMLSARRALEARAGLFCNETVLELAKPDRVGPGHWY
jgi:phosphoribosyl 1,2-cyclic phosphodiesterase